MFHAGMASLRSRFSLLTARGSTRPREHPAAAAAFWARVDFGLLVCFSSFPPPPFFFSFAGERRHNARAVSSTSLPWISLNPRLTAGLLVAAELVQFWGVQLGDRPVLENSVPFLLQNCL